MPTAQPITITINNTMSFSWKTHHTLLEALEQAGIDINHSCRTGVCGACRIRLVSGKVHWHTQALINLRPHEILACAVRPLCDLKLELPD